MDRGSKAQSMFLRVAELIGDFGSPFYTEERQRDVWNEASAFGLQLVIWLGLLAATVLAWVSGADAVPYALSLLVLIGFVSLATITYARCLGVAADDASHVSRFRLMTYVAVVALLILGIANSGALGASLPFVVGLLGGTGAAVVAVMLAARRRNLDP